MIRCGKCEMLLSPSPLDLSDAIICTRCATIYAHLERGVVEVTEADLAAMPTEQREGLIVERDRAQARLLSPTNPQTQFWFLVRRKFCR